MKCKHCKKSFYASNKDRKYCSTSCRSTVNNKLRAKPKELKMTKEIKLIGDYWHGFHRGWFTLQDIKNLMKERYVSNKVKETYDLFKPNNIEL